VLLECQPCLLWHIIKTQSFRLTDQAVMLHLCLQLKVMADGLCCHFQIFNWSASPFNTKVIISSESRSFLSFLLIYGGVSTYINSVDSLRFKTKLEQTGQQSRRSSLMAQKTCIIEKETMNTIPDFTLISWTHASEYYKL
jgi:hypothetical protein